MRRVLKVAGGLILAAVLIVLYLIRFQGLRIERDGTGMKPMFSFYQAEQHMAAIEENRALPQADPAAVSDPAKQIPASKPYWTDFRGPGRDGHYDEMPILTKWSSGGPQRLWRKPIGGGYASFVIANGNAFTIEQRRNQEVASAYDMATGREVWSHGWDALFQESMGGDGPRATPAWHEGRVYALGAAGELRCLDAATGRRLWSK